MTGEPDGAGVGVWGERTAPVIRAAHAAPPAFCARGQPVPRGSDVAQGSRPAGAEITGQATRATRTPGRALAKLQSNIDDGALVFGPADRAEVITIAERIAAQPTVGGGHRFRDVLHIATAQSPGTAEFRSFDSNRRWPAVAAGLAATPHRRAAAGRGEFRSAPGHETRECRRSLIANGSHPVSAPGVWMNRVASASVRPKLTSLRSDWLKPSAGGFLDMKNASYAQGDAKGRYSSAGSGLTLS